MTDAKQVDVRPLFEVLRDLGGVDAAAVLAQLPTNATVVQYLRNKNTTRISPTVKTYALIALASLPDGEGIPTLAALAGDPHVPIERRPAEPYLCAGDEFLECASRACAFAAHSHAVGTGEAWLRQTKAGAWLPHSKWGWHKSWT